MAIAAIIADTIAQLECEATIANIAAEIEARHEISHAIAECLAMSREVFEGERSYVGPMLAA